MKKTRYIPYGYTMQNGATVVEHSEAEVIRRIFESYINGNSLKDIADELTRLKVPYTEKTSVWDKARIARIIENAKYIGDREYAPIIDEEIYESAVQCKIARKTNQMRIDSETIRFLRDRVKCGECGYPMTRTLQSSCKIKERWTCTNPECGCRVRISDSVLIEKVTMLINRIIENSALLEPGKEHRKKDTPPSIQHMTEEIMAEAASPAGSEQLILDRIREIAKERYRNSNIEKELALRIAKRQTEYMKAQNDFNRDYFQSLISYVTIGSDGTVGVRTKTDTTVTKSVSRFARNTVECLDYVRMLKSRGIGILFEEQNIDTLKSDSELYLVIYAGFAQAESESISKNITWSKRKNFEEGKVSLQYKKMLGYRKGEDGEPEIVPEEAKLVERIFDLYIAGETPLSISEILQAENPTFEGKHFTYGKGMIEGILFNVKYCGDAILQQSVTVDPIMKKRKKNTGEALMYYVQNSHPAIVTREKFNKAQEERARRRTFAPKSQKAAITATGKYSRYALSQVLICAECGSPYKRVHWNIRGKKSIVWRCVNRLDHGTQYCKESPTLREDKLKEAVVRAIRQFNEQDANTYTTLMKATIAEAIGFDGSDDEKELLERQVNGLNDKMIAIVNESIASGEDIESREGEIKEIADTIEDLKRRIQIITENSMKNAEYADRIAEIERIITERASHQNEYDDSIVRQMVECIKVYADKHIEVIFGGGYAVEETVE